jgi:hypothetical protein
MGAGGDADAVKIAFIFIDNRAALVKLDGVLRADFDTLSCALTFVRVNFDFHGVVSFFIYFFPE